MSRQTRIALGVSCVFFGAWQLHQAYDAQGKGRPFLLRLLPG